MEKPDYENMSSTSKSSAVDSPVESQVDDLWQSSESGMGVQPLSLSNSVRGALKRLQTDAPVPASAIAQQLLNMHGKEYTGNGREISQRNLCGCARKVGTTFQRS